MKSHIFIGVASVGVALMVMLGGMSEKTAIAQGQKRVLPIFVVDANFPTMPEHMEMGGVGGVDADVVESCCSHRGSPGVTVTRLAS